MKLRSLIEEGVYNEDDEDEEVGSTKRHKDGNLGLPLEDA